MLIERYGAADKGGTLRNRVNSISRFSPRYGPATKRGANILEDAGYFHGLDNVKMKIGDCFCIPLPTGKWAYCQYIYQHEMFGALVQIFDRITEEALDSTVGIEGAGYLLPPVFVFLQNATRGGGWKRIGRLPVSAFEFPLFRSTIGTKPGVYKDWRIWDGKKTTYIGELPESMRSLELECVWGSDAIANRIAAGTYRGDRMF